MTNFSKATTTLAVNKQYTSSHRKALGLTQSKLARLAEVSRFKLCTFELGGGSLSANEHTRLLRALETEAARLRNLPKALTEVRAGAKAVPGDAA